MNNALVIQSHRSPLPYAWLQDCLDSVAGWARRNRFDYRFIGDELFDPVEPGLLEKTRRQIVIASDLARLKWLQQSLADGYDCVVWCDADVLIFAPAQFVLPDADFALGREIWVQQDKRGGLRVYPKVHNALLMFRRGNHFLDFYSDSAERLLRSHQGGMPAQVIGPKLLTALHNIVTCPVMETAGMLSPAVIRDLLGSGGEALQLFREKSPVAVAGANLSASLAAAAGFDEAQMQALIRRLMQTGIQDPEAASDA